MRKILTIFLFISLVSCSEYKENSALEKCASEGFMEYFPYYKELYANDEEYKAVEFNRLMSSQEIEKIRAAIATAQDKKELREKLERAYENNNKWTKLRRETLFNVAKKNFYKMTLKEKKELSTFVITFQKCEEELQKTRKTFMLKYGS